MSLFSDAYAAAAAAVYAENDEAPRARVIREVVAQQYGLPAGDYPAQTLAATPAYDPPPAGATVAPVAPVPTPAGAPVPAAGSTSPATGGVVNLGTSRMVTDYASGGAVVAATGQKMTAAGSVPGYAGASGGGTVPAYTGAAVGGAAAPAAAAAGGGVDFARWGFYLAAAGLLFALLRRR